MCSHKFHLYIRCYDLSVISVVLSISIGVMSFDDFFRTVSNVPNENTRTDEGTKKKKEERSKDGKLTRKTHTHYRET